MTARLEAMGSPALARENRFAVAGGSAGAGARAGRAVSTGASQEA